MYTDYYTEMYELKNKIKECEWMATEISDQVAKEMQNIKSKKCYACGAHYDVMMYIRTGEVIKNKEKKTKERWVCPNCMAKIVTVIEGVKKMHGN